MNAKSTEKDVRANQLRALATLRKAKSERAIQAAVAELDKQHRPITVAAVAKRAGVTRQTVYNSSYRKEIEEIRDRTRSTDKQPTIRARASEASLKRRLDLALQEIQHLTAENAKLQKSLADILAQYRAMQT